MQRHKDKIVSPFDNILLTIVLSFASGIALGSTISTDILLIPALIATGAILCMHRSFYKFSFLILIALFILIGSIHVKKYLEPPKDPNHIYHLINKRQNVSVIGTLAQSPIVTDGPVNGIKTRLIINVEKLVYPISQNNASGSYQKPSRGLIRLTMKDRIPKNIRPGDIIMINALLARLSTLSTPGTFNYVKHLSRQSIWVTGWIKSGTSIIKVRSTSHSSIASIFSYYTEGIRQKIALFIDNNIEQPSRGIYKAILIGDKSSIPPDIQENFKIAGCFHILAISGLHMGLLAFISISAIRWLLLRSTWLTLQVPVTKIATLITLLPLIIYAFVAGLNTPVVRALLMTLVFITAIFFDRQWSLINNIAIAVMLVLIWKPVVLFSASFQLSFSAVIAIAIILPIIYQLIQENYFFKNNQSGINMLSPALKLLSKIANWTSAGLIVSFAAFAGTAPFLVYHFNRISTVSAVANLAVEPLICLWSLVSGLIACLMIPFFPNIAATVFNFGSWGIVIANKIAAKFAAIPFSQIWVARPSSIEIISYYALLAGILFWKKNNIMKIVLILSLLVLIITPTTFIIKRTIGAETKVTFLDIGQGSSTVLELPKNRVVLIDGGGARSDTFNVGERIIAPFLWYKRYRRIDDVIVSHPHADHFNGLLFILQRFRPKILWINGQNGPDKNYRKLIQTARELGIVVKITKPDSILYMCETATLKCINNSFASINQEYGIFNDKREKKYFRNINNNSLVLRLDLQDKGKEAVSFLFPGDISKGMEKHLVENNFKIDADILLSPHHGNISSNSEEFLRKVSPKYIVVSAGRFSHLQKHYKKLVIQNDNLNIKQLSTAKNGSITFSYKKGKLEVEQYQVNI